MLGRSDKIGRACGKHDKKEKRMPGFYKKNLGQGTTWKA
jgi:hypothetical protein